MNFKGRRLLITGGASGVGMATAGLLASHGARVGLIDREPAVEAVAGELGGHGYVADVTDEGAVRQAVSRFAAEVGGIDGLVHCAGIVLIKPTGEITLAEWKRVIDVNLTGTFVVCQAVLPWLRRAERATIVNVASAQALMPTANANAYAASKAGVVMFSKSLAAELAPHIRVNTVCPGLIDTPMNKVTHGNDDAATAARVLARYPLGRKADALEIAQAIAFLSSPASSYITCSALAVDGGRSFH
ncbi:MAG: SDR family NAD(P)-dependent oxidoreductase [Burkholderiaceae bacterium]|nr:SDR family NAD(P)-dependent oxidoreductase [Burkholderiaceae bacterium]